MWLCPRCHKENEEQAIACAHCGVRRPSGRFQPADESNAVQPPRVTAPRAQAPIQHRERQRTQRHVSACPPPETGFYPVKRKKPGFLIHFARFVGGMLCILLPLITLFCAIGLYPSFSGMLLPLVLQDMIAEWVGIMLFVLASFLSLLLSVLPGLWTLLLVRAAGNKR